MISAKEAKIASRRVIYKQLREQAKQVREYYPEVMETVSIYIREAVSLGHGSINVHNLGTGISDSRIRQKVLKKVCKKLLTLGYTISYYGNLPRFISWD